MNSNGSSEERLALYAGILTLIDAKRQESGAEMLGSSIENFIISAQFAEIEADILENPGAFEPWLIRPMR